MKVDYRERIIEEASKLFLRHGISETGVADIANAVGISKGTLYYHFKNKHAIIDEITTRYFDKMDRAFLLVSDGYFADKSVVDIISIVVSVIRQNVETELLHYILLAYGVISYPELKERFKDKYDEWLSLIKRGMDKNMGESVSNDFYSQLIFSLIEGMAIRCVLGMENVDIDPVELAKMLERKS